MTIKTLGIDVAKEKFDVVLLKQERPRHHTFSNNRQGFRALSAWLAGEQTSDLHACLEATGTYGPGSGPLPVSGTGAGECGQSGLCQGIRPE